MHPQHHAVSVLGKGWDIVQMSRCPFPGGVEDTAHVCMLCEGRREKPQLPLTTILMRGLRVPFRDTGNKNLESAGTKPGGGRGCIEFVILAERRRT